MFAKAQDGHFRFIEILSMVEIVQSLYFAGLPVTKITGFRDETTGNIILPNNAEIIFDWIDFEKWKKLGFAFASVILWQYNTLQS